MEKKMTKREYFAIIRKIVAASNSDQKEGCLIMIDREVELLNNKTSKTNSKMSAANDAIKMTVIEVLDDLKKPMTITEMLQDSRLTTYERPAKGDAVTIETMTSQKLSSIVSKMVESNTLVRTMEKKKAYFSLPKDEGVTVMDEETH